MSKKEQQFPLAQTALDWLKHGADEKYELRLHGEEALALALKALFSSGLDPKPPIELLLGLASTLHFEWSSPTAARLIVGVLIDSPKVRALFGLGDDKNEYLARGKAFLEGSKTKLAAPKYGEAGAKGSVRMTDLVDPSKLRPGGRIR